MFWGIESFLLFNASFKEHCGRLEKALARYKKFKRVIDIAGSLSFLCFLRWNIAYKEPGILP